MALLLGPHIYDLQRSIRQFDDVPRFQGFGVYVLHVVWVEDARLAAVEDRLLAGRVSETETAPAVRQLASLPSKSGEKGGEGIPGLFAWCTDDRNALWHHDLISNVRVEISAAHEARLRRMRVYPSEHHQLLLVAVIEYLVLVDCFTSIRRAGLLGDQESGDE